LAPKFIFGDKSGGHDTIYCFDGKEGDRVDIKGDYNVGKNDHGEMVICWNEGDTVTLAGVAHVDSDWIV
jgi:hypothetical protein